MTKYICNVRTYNGNSDYTLDLNENYDIVVKNLEQVEQYLKQEYDLTGFNDLASDDTSIVLEKSYKAWRSDHGNIHEVHQCDDCDKAELENDGLCENHFWYSEQIDAHMEKAKKADLEYIKSDKYFKSVVDLTEK